MEYSTAFELAEAYNVSYNKIISAIRDIRNNLDLDLSRFKISRMRINEKGKARAVPAYRLDLFILAYSELKYITGNQCVFSLSYGRFKKSLENRKKTLKDVYGNTWKHNENATETPINTNIQHGNSRIQQNTMETKWKVTTMKTQKRMSGMS